MIVRSYYDVESFPDVPTPSGDVYLQQYERVDDPNVPGSWSIRKTDSVNIQDMINSARPPKMTDLVKRAMRGDLRVLDVHGDTAQYLDVSEFQNRGYADVFDGVSAAKVSESRIQAALDAAAVSSVSDPEPAVIGPASTGGEQ